jgi:3-oxoacyl-[acyl-carrier protein] reductase
MRLDLREMTALVTGGSRGIGAATVRSLHAAGARVHFTYAAASDAARALCAELGDDRVSSERCDSADPTALESLVAGCLERWGRIDVLVNNAGIYAENPLDGSDFAAWRAGWARTFAVNVFGVADLCWLVARSMRGNEPNPNGIRGRIVTITSRAAHRAEPEFADYAASKAAAGNLMKSIARGAARDGIVAFSVAPGFIATDMAAAAIAAEGKRIRAEIPSGRIGTPEEVANIVTFLASGLADYATGTTIDINGASYVR